MCIHTNVPVLHHLHTHPHLLHIQVSVRFWTMQMGKNRNSFRHRGDASKGSKTVWKGKLTIYQPGYPWLAAYPELTGVSSYKCPCFKPITMHPPPTQLGKSGESVKKRKKSGRFFFTLPLLTGRVTICCCQDYCNMLVQYLYHLAMGFSWFWFKLHENYKHELPLVVKA